MHRLLLTVSTNRYAVNKDVYAELNCISTLCHVNIRMLCHYFDTGYVVLQNTDVLPSGSAAFVYAVLLDALVPYLANFQPKVHNYYHNSKM